MPKSAPKKSSARLTAKALAQKLGVSQATVSLALNNNPLVNVETRKRVQEAALRFNYRPNRVARAMRTGRTRLIGMIVPSVRFSFYPDIIDEVERGARENGAQCLFCQSHGLDENLEAGISMLLEQQVDGLLLTPLDAFEKRPIYRHLLDIGMPTIFCDYDPGTKTIAAAASHNMEIGRLMARHLVELGHRRIAFLQGNRTVRNYRVRFEGFRQFFKEAGLPLHPELICGYDEPQEAIDLNRGGSRDSIGGYDDCGKALDGGEVVMRLLDRGHAFTAVAAAGDLLAIPAMRALQGRGIRVPEDISVIGCANLDATSLVSPALTTIDQNGREIGREAVRLLFQQIRTPRAPGQRIRIAPSLIVRESTALRKSRRR